jgi:hypothetical protein
VEYCEDKRIIEQLDPSCLRRQVIPIVTQPRWTWDKRPFVHSADLVTECTPCLAVDGLGNDVPIVDGRLERTVGTETTPVVVSKVGTVCGVSTR